MCGTHRIPAGAISLTHGVATTTICFRFYGAGNSCPQKRTCAQRVGLLRRGGTGRETRTARHGWGDAAWFTIDPGDVRVTVNAGLDVEANGSGANVRARFVDVSGALPSTETRSRTLTATGRKRLALDDVVPSGAETAKARFGVAGCSSDILLDAFTAERGARRGLRSQCGPGRRGWRRGPRAGGGRLERSARLRGPRGPRCLTTAAMGPALQQVPSPGDSVGSLSSQSPPSSV